MCSLTHIRVCAVSMHYAAGSGGRERTVSTITVQGCNVFNSSNKTFLAVAVDNT